MTTAPNGEAEYIEIEYFELAIEPIPPDTVSSVKADLIPRIEAALREVGRERMLEEGEIEVEIEKTFPSEAVVIVGLTFLSTVASGIIIETYKALLNSLERYCRVQERRRQKAKRRKKEN